MNLSKKSKLLKYKCLLFLLLPLFIPQIVNADNSQADTTTTSEVLPVMPTIHVEAARIAPTTGMTIIDKEMIENLPSGNGNITDLLKTTSGIQFSEDYESSKTGGEILPGEVSISGGRPEDNSYILDGIGNNSILDPSFTSIINSDNIPGHSQELFIQDHLVDNIKVLKANIPASYGGFSGGIIDTETINPRSEFGGSISFDMTRSTWGKFHIDPEEKDNFYNSTDATNQPNFTKYRLNTTFHVPLNEEASLLFDYSRLQSKIPLELLGDAETQHRKNENIFLKLIATPHPDTELIFSAIYAPYEGIYFLKDTLNSEYKLIGGGWRLNSQLNQDTDKGNLEFNINFQESYNNREAPTDKYSWRATPSKNWGTLLGNTVSLEGGYGDIKKQEKSFSSNIHFQSVPIVTNTIVHQINSGFELSYSQATFDREETSIENLAWLADGTPTSLFSQLVSCESSDPECINGEQFIYQKNVRPKDNARAQILNLDAYIENKIKIEKLSVRPGVRVSYNNFQDNTDFAPRLNASFDFWNNGKTVLIGGGGRYYNTNLLTLKLEEQKKPYEIYRRSFFLSDGEPESWPEDPRPRSSIPASRTSKLDTPYANELSIGLQQQIMGGQSEALYINRNYKDQIVSVIFDIDDDGYVYKEWKNSGRRTYEELSLNWQKKWSKHFLSFNISWQKVKSNSSSYADLFSEDLLGDDPDYVWYDEKLMLREDLPPNNFSRPIKASLIYTTQLPFRFSFTNITSYRGHYKALTQEGTDPDGIYDAYTVTRIPSALTYDWKIAWKSSDWKNNNIECSLDILNVLDRTIRYGVDDDYLLGRQFWAGITYNF